MSSWQSDMTRAPIGERVLVKNREDGTPYYAVKGNDGEWRNPVVHSCVYDPQLWSKERIIVSMT